MEQIIIMINYLGLQCIIYYQVLIKHGLNYYEILFHFKQKERYMTLFINKCLESCQYHKNKIHNRFLLENSLYTI